MPATAPPMPRKVLSQPGIERSALGDQGGADRDGADGADGLTELAATDAAGPPAPAALAAAEAAANPRIAFAIPAM